MVFVLAMVLYPDVQKRAQAEIDSVIGKDRLPTFEDRASLPYIDAIKQEVFRWAPVNPLVVIFAMAIMSLLRLKMTYKCHMPHRMKICTMVTSYQKVCFIVQKYGVYILITVL